MTAQNPAGCWRLSEIRQAAAEATCVSPQYYHFQCMALKLLCLQQDKLEMLFNRSLICASECGSWWVTTLFSVMGLPRVCLSCLLWFQEL